MMYQGDSWTEGLEPFGAFAGGGEPVGEEELTERERTVLQFVSRGLLTPEIAAELASSPEDVKTHLEIAMQKLHARTRAHAVALAAARGEIALVSEIAIPAPAPGARVTSGA